MAEKTISTGELLRMIEDGAIVRAEQKNMVIEQFDELIKKLQGLIEAQQARATADLARSQTQLEIMGSLQTMIKQQGGRNSSAPVDLAPLHTVLSEMQETQALHAEPHDYEFTFDRGAQGYMTKVHAKVVRPTQH